MAAILVDRRAGLVSVDALGYLEVPLLILPKKTGSAESPARLGSFLGDDGSLEAILEIANGRTIDTRTKVTFPQLAALPQGLDTIVA
jgi:hypothetical protein